MSLRARLLAAMALVAGVLALGAVLIVQTTESYLFDQADEELHDTRPPAGLRGPPNDQTRQLQLSPVFIGSIGPDGDLSTEVTPARVTEKAELPRVTVAQVRESVHTGAPFTTESLDGSLRYRALATPFGGRYVQVVARPLDDVDATITRLIVLEVLAVAAVLAVLALVTWWVLRLGVRPVKQMTATATAIADGDLSRRVPRTAPGTEAGALGVALNRMLARIEEAFAERTRSEARLRQFIADASHELRTPVATVRGYAELYRAGALDDPERLGDAMRRTEAEAVRMGTLVDDLLHLARLDQGRPLERAPVRLDEIVADAVRDAQAVDPERPVRAELDGPVTVLGDDGRLRQVVANLIGNALVHTPADVAVTVAIHRHGGTDTDTVTLEVHDEGPGMTAEVAERVFERFYRADPARSRHRGGSGLGLAIVHATVGAHGGSVELETAPGDGTTVRVTLPTARAPLPVVEA